MFRDGVLFESTGHNGKSSVAKGRLETGEVLQRYDVDARYFAEGLTDWGARLVQLTYTTNVGFVYDLASFELQRTFTYTGEGWGLTHDERRLIMSDGTSALRFLDPETLRETGHVVVTDGDHRSTISTSSSSSRARSTPTSGRPIALRSSRRIPGESPPGSIWPASAARSGRPRRRPQRHRLRCGARSAVRDRQVVAEAVRDSGAALMSRPNGTPGRPVTIRAHAKINLDLRVLGTRPDGYHELRTVFQAIALHDISSASRARARLRSNATRPACRSIARISSGAPPTRCGDALRRTAPSATCSSAAEAHSAAGRSRRRQRRRGRDAAGAGAAWRVPVRPAQLMDVAATLGADVAVLSVGRHGARAGPRRRGLSARRSAAPLDRAAGAGIRRVDAGRVRLVRRRARSVARPAPASRSTCLARGRRARRR